MCVAEHCYTAVRVSGRVYSSGMAKRVVRNNAQSGNVISTLIGSDSEQASAWRPTSYLVSELAAVHADMQRAGMDETVAH